MLTRVGCRAIIAGWMIITAALASGASAADPNHPLAAPDPKLEGMLPTPMAPGEGAPVDNRALLADLYRRLGKSDSPEVAGATATAIERFWLVSGSDTIDLLVARALEAHASGEKELALTLLDSVTALAPDYAEGFVRRALLRAQAQRLPEAEDDLIQALALDPNHFRAWEGLGQILRQLDRKALALEAFRQLLLIYPANADAKTAVETLEREVEGQKI